MAARAAASFDFELADLLGRLSDDRSQRIAAAAAVLGLTR
jgi:hypothetical protein